MLVFGAFAHFAETRMVAVLLAALRVAPRRLNVAIREGAYPDFGPRGRIASALMRFRTSISVSFEPSARP